MIGMKMNMNTTMIIRGLNQTERKGIIQMTAQDVRKAAVAIVTMDEYFEGYQAGDGWLCVGGVPDHAWQILLIRRASYLEERFVVHVWNPVQNKIQFSVVADYSRVWITEGDV